MTAFAELLWQSLPGLYRDEDERGELRAFLELVALPLEELEASIDQLREDLAIGKCRPELIPLVGALVGADVSAGLTPRAQRDQVRDAIPFYRSKGLGDPLLAFAESVTGWRVERVDFSDRIAQFPFVQTLAPVDAVRRAPVSESPPGSGFFRFRADGADGPLFDALIGRPITRAALAADGPAYAGHPDRFTIAERGADLFPDRTVVSVDLSDFARRIRIPANAVAVDPQLGRFRFGSRAPLAGNLRASFHALPAASVRPQAMDVRDPDTAARIGRSDDPVPYTLDLRAPHRPTDRSGHQHFDNHGLFCTPAVVCANRRPNVLPPGSESGNFTFDDRPLPLGDADGVALQLLDGVDGAPLTRARLAGASRSVAIRVGTLELRSVAADLSDFAAAPALPPGDAAVDPQLGRFRVDLAALGALAADVRVDYLLAPVRAVERGLRVAGDLFAFEPDGAEVALVDAFDGTRIAVALRLGAKLGRYHGTARGWSVRRNGADVTGALPPVVLDLGDPATVAPAGRLAIDLERARVRFPPGFLAPGDAVAVGAHVADPAGETQVFESLAQQLPRAMPAGVVPVIADTRLPRRDGAQLT
ncbi:MAG TPA: hypothetical protein VNO82_03750 [Solirubrobacteraceae bacterium]|nr:hypothetical protein [Solirubrobacteraceae bacterium]